MHGAARPRPRPLRAARRVRPVAGLLRQQLPQPGEHRARGGDAEDGRHHPHHRLHHPPLLPRLLRRGLRRVGADPVDAGEPDGDGRRRQQVAGVRGLRDGEDRQGGRGGRVPRPGLLRRHTHHRHTGRHRPERRALLPGGAGQAGWPELHGQQRGRQAAAAHQHPQPDGRHVQGARAHHVRHRRPLSGAHGGARALRKVQGPGVRQPGGRDAEPKVRGVPEDQVPRRRLVGPDGAHGPGHAGALRQPVLPEPAGRRRPARLRPAPLQRQPHAPPRQLVGQQHGRLQPGLRRRHGQARPRRGQVRQRRQHTQAVRRLQLMTKRADRCVYTGITTISVRACVKGACVHEMCVPVTQRFVGFHCSVWLVHGCICCLIR